MTNTSAEKAPLELIAASLRRERRRSGLSLTELARRAGIAKSTLSQLESGTGNPSLETLWAICVALDVPFSRLVDPPRPHTQVIRVDEGPTIAAAEADYRATLLASCPPGARHDVYRIEAEPGQARASEPHMPGVVEHVVLSTGRALVGVTGEAVDRVDGRAKVTGSATYAAEVARPSLVHVVMVQSTIARGRWPPCSRSTSS